jgi:hypothetical protein
MDFARPCSQLSKVRAFVRQHAANTRRAKLMFAQSNFLPASALARLLIAFRPSN